MIKPQKSCASFVKGKFCSIEDVVSLKWLLVPERIDFTVLKMTFKGLLNERMPSNFQISINEKKREVRTATETIKLTLTSKPNYESHFTKYATTLYNEVPKPIQEPEKNTALQCSCFISSYTQPSFQMHSVTDITLHFPTVNLYRCLQGISTI